MNRTIQKSLYIIMLIAINGNSCFANEIPSNVVHHFAPDIVTATSGHFVTPQSDLEKQQFESLTAACRNLSDQITLLNTNSQKYCSKTEFEEKFKNFEQTLSEVAQKIIAPVNKDHAELTLQFKDCQTQLTKQQTLINSLQSQLNQLTLHVNQQPQPPIVINATGGSATATNGVTNTQNTTPSRFYSRLINARTLIISILMVSSSLYAGPIGAALVAGFSGGFVLFWDKEAFAIFKKRLAIGLTGSAVAVGACLVAAHSKDKDIVPFAMVVVPVSLGLTAVALAAD